MSRYGLSRFLLYPSPPASTLSTLSHIHCISFRLPVYLTHLCLDPESSWLPPGMIAPILSRIASLLVLWKSDLRLSWPPFGNPLWFVAALVNKLVPWCVELLSSALNVLRLRLRLRLLSCLNIHDGHKFLQLGLAYCIFDYDFVSLFPF